MPAIPPDHRLDAASDAGLVRILAAAARRQPDGVLVLSAALGLVVGTVVLMVDALWMPLALPAAAAAAFGGWGIVDRTASEHRARHGDATEPGAADGTADGVAGADRALGALGTLLGLAGWALALLM